MLTRQVFEKHARYVMNWAADERPPDQALATPKPEDKGDAASGSNDTSTKVTATVAMRVKSDDTQKVKTKARFVMHGNAET